MWSFARLLRRADRRKPAPSPDILDIPLCWFSERDPFTLRDGCQGVQVFGGVGSGKTSGSGQMLARCCLRAGMGGLVMVAKPDETDRWRQYAAEEGRSEDLIVISRDGPWTYNFLGEELKKSGGNIENAVHLFSRALEVGGRTQQGSQTEPFWEDARKQLFRNVTDAVYSATGTASLTDLHEVIQSAPRSLEEAESRVWQERSVCMKCLRAAEMATRGDAARTHDFKRTADYWLREFPSIPEKTRNTIITNFTAVTDPFLRHPLCRLFCKETTVKPEDSFRGKIIVLDLSVKTEGFTGRFAQVLFKLCWQNAAERRRAMDEPFPVFLFADESHYFLTKSDQEFLTTARSARVIPIFLTQSVSNYYAEFGQQRDAANAVLATLNLKLFHANNDAETNEWASRVIGQQWQDKMGFSRGSSSGQKAGAATDSTSAQVNEQLAARVLPSDFINLPTGGPQNAFVVGGIACRSGAPFRHSATNFLSVEFPQHQS